MDEKLEVSLVRPFDFSHSKYHIDKWREKNITVLICQRNTLDLIKLSLESLLRFYPDIPILIMVGDSNDNSLQYLKYKSISHPNIKIVIGKNTTAKFTSHGVTMDVAIREHLTTRYVLLMDSDVIIERGGIIEDMLGVMRKSSDTPEELYAIGSIMLVTREGHACGPPKSDSDILRYAHPSFSIYDASKYKILNAPFVDHGAPCVYNMIEAEKLNLSVGYYPVDKYVSHLSGGSWTEPRTIWANDHNVPTRPIVTFIISNGDHIEKLKLQTDHDFDIVTTGNRQQRHLVIHGSAPVMVDNYLCDIRNNVIGEYVCVLPHDLNVIQPNFVKSIKDSVVDNRMPDEINVGGLNCVKRTLWQRRDSLK